MKVFVTGGAGYIGSHTIVELLRAGHDVLSCDNYCNSSPEALKRVRRLANSDLREVNLDVRDGSQLGAVMGDFGPNAVIHFAGLKAVGASSAAPLEYYDSNVVGTLRVLQAMDLVGCKSMVFSSSATVYGDAQYLPYDEDHPLAPTNPYGRTKLIAEQLISDWHNAHKDASAVLLRYFNPVGAHSSGDIGEDPTGVPDNLMPYVAQVACGRRSRLNVFGDDYDTQDGTGERDYVHVVDLARAHVRAVEYASTHAVCEPINIGTGKSYSVLQLVKEFERVSGKRVPLQIAARRTGDVAKSFAATERAHNLLGWKASHSLTDMCESNWIWQSRNPNGYGSE